MKSSVIFLVLSIALFSRARAALPPCTATFCGTNGALASCYASGTLTGPIQCCLWAHTAEAAWSCKALKCNNSCYFIPVYGSDGNPYCTPCHLHKFSCTVNFKVFGPVGGPFPAGETKRIADAPSGVPTVERAADAGHVPTVERILPPRCSMEFCTNEGAAEKCTFMGGPVVPAIISCRKYARTEESKKQCAFGCIAICVPEDERPLGSDGVRYCSLCQLQSASCASHYKIFGPVKAEPEVEKCSVGLCTSRGKDQECRFEGATDAGSRKITCGKWAGTEEKEAACAFFCPLFCLPEDEQPVDNNGKKHCSACQLASASCAADFAIYGPN